MSQRWRVAAAAQLASAAAGPPRYLGAQVRVQRLRHLGVKGRQQLRAGQWLGAAAREAWPDSRRLAEGRAANRCASASGEQGFPALPDGSRRRTCGSISTMEVFRPRCARFSAICSEGVQAAGWATRPPAHTGQLACTPTAARMRPSHQLTSKPMKPPPTTTADCALLAAIQCLMARLQRYHMARQALGFCRVAGHDGQDASTSGCCAVADSNRQAAVPS